jgi:hypothetical protein
MNTTNKPRMPDLRRASLTTSSRFYLAAGGGAHLTLLLLLLHVFVPAEWLQLVSIWILGGSLLCAWGGILTWRMPVFANRSIFLFVFVWASGIAASVWLAIWAFASRPSIWRHSMQWLSFTLSFVVGALLLRALLRKRSAPVIGRLLSLVSPLIILLVIVITSLVRAP